LVLDRYGRPPFGTLLSANADGSTLLNFGDAPWVSLHQVGNRRNHDVCWHLTEIHGQSRPSRPALNGEPYYAGWPPRSAAEGGSEEDDLYCRAAMYGSFLSGGLAGHIYGADGLWGGCIEPAAAHRMWESIRWRSGAQMQHLRTFALSEGRRYQDLIPNAEGVTPNKWGPTGGNRGWSYCAHTPDRALFMLYFEAPAPDFPAPPATTIRGALPNQGYRAHWFDPRAGEWLPAGRWLADQRCAIERPDPPSKEDWGLKLVIEP
jgi:hypothetical protein